MLDKARAVDLHVRLMRRRLPTYTRTNAPVYSKVREWDDQIVRNWIAGAQRGDFVTAPVTPEPARSETGTTKGLHDALA